MSTGDRIECFWMEPTEMARADLRRYEKICYDPKPPPSCPQNRMSHHDTTVYIGDVPYPFDPQGLLGSGRDDVPHNDPRWPLVCDVCSTPFRDEDHWQHNLNRLFSGAPDGKLYTTRDMPPGAMFDVSWWPDKGPDGRCIAVCLPPGRGDLDIWLVDGPSNNGSPWTRTGTTPRITASPSILTPRYHGHLVDGWLVEC